MCIPDILNVSLSPDIFYPLEETFKLTTVSKPGHQGHDQKGRQQNERSHQDAER